MPPILPVPALAIGEREETLGNSNAPAISSAREPHVDGSFVRSRYGHSWWLASWADQTEQMLSLPSELLHPGFQSSRHPEDCRI